LHPAYLIVGEDALKRQTALARLRDRLDADLEGGYNHDRFDAERTDAALVVGACNTLPFMGSRRLVELSNVDKLGKADAEMLVSYLGKPNDATILVLEGDKLSKSTKLYKAVAAFGAKCIIDCTPMKKYELERAVRSMSISHGAAITQRAAELLVRYVGNDTVRIDAELEKLALAHEGDDPISESDIKSLVVESATHKYWEFVDAFSRRDIQACLKLYGRLERETPFSLLAKCTGRVRELICAKSLDQRGEGALLADTLGVSPWRIKNHIAWSRLYGSAELRQILIDAARAEQEMKSSSDADGIFLDWAARACADTAQ
jgi:DNA polymerase-3 subunit delta